MAAYDDLQAAIQARCDAESTDAVRVGLGAPGDIIEFEEPGIDNKQSGQGWGPGKAWDVITKGITDWVASLGFDALPSGTILMFNSGSIPSGWALCDGTNGTPDLRNKFVRGATTPGATGGDNNTGIPTATTEVQSGSGATVASSTHTHPHTPPYHALVFIMKL